MEGLKFALLSGGTGYNDIAWNFQGYGLATADDRQGSKDVWQAFSYLYTVICHPTAGYVLFDVGLGPGEECDRRPAEHRRINPVEVRRDQYVDEGLKKLGLTVDEALPEVDSFIDRAILNGQTVVYLIHGNGTGALRTAIHKHLRGNRMVKSFRLGRYGEGESGVTVVELK